MKLVSALLLLSLSAARASHSTDLEWAKLDVSLPKAISDHTASIASSGLVYIAGGCDSPDGNKFVATSETDGFFACDSLSNSFYSFDFESLTFETLADLPRERYRHSSVIVNNQVWLVGGRTVEDALIAEIDVYDIDSATWTTVNLPENYQVSDHAGFAEEPSFVYIVGGFNAGYTALDQVARIDATSIDADALVIETRDPILAARGDIIGVASADGSSAYISGGFTHENNFCAPLGSTEKLDIGTGVWSALPDLVNERGEVVLVEAEDHLYALGGERQIPGICGPEAEGLQPGEKTVGTDEVEVLEGDDWEIASDFPDQKFRFAAVTSPDGLVFTFGGQSQFSLQCQCFKTTDEVQVFGPNAGSAAAVASQTLPMLALASIVALIMI